MLDMIIYMIWIRIYFKWFNVKKWKNKDKLFIKENGLSISYDKRRGDDIEILISGKKISIPLLEKEMFRDRFFLYSYNCLPSMNSIILKI